jgi:MoxR-like ATPase
LVIALLTDGHVLLEGVPGLAKTLALKSLANCLSVRFKRLQFTPDMLPADIVGTMIYNPQDGAFRTKHGPIFSNLILADEINRAPAKVQSALLEAMQERQVNIGRDTHRLPDPFLVMATQNPIESDGTYPLPEAQVDRFMLKVLVDYPTATEEFVIVERMLAGFEKVNEVMDAQQLRGLQREVLTVFVDPALIEYAVRVSAATRDLSSVGLPDVARYVTYGVSPRASINLVAAARALALLRGRRYVLPEDVRTIAPDVLRHRLVLSYEALGDDVGPDEVVDAVLDRIPVPDVVLRNA